MIYDVFYMGRANWSNPFENHNRGNINSILGGGGGIILKIDKIKTNKRTQPVLCFSVANG